MKLEKTTIKIYKQIKNQSLKKEINVFSSAIS